VIGQNKPLKKVWKENWSEDVRYQRIHHCWNFEYVTPSALNGVEVFAKVALVDLKFCYDLENMEVEHLIKILLFHFISIPFHEPQSKLCF
jgi:hypothetical protein